MNKWKAIFYKTYSLKNKSHQIIFIVGIIFFLCLLSIIPIQLNGDTPTKFSLTSLLSILVFFFTSCGMLSGQMEVSYHESRQLSLLVGNKSKAIISLLIVDLLDCIIQSIIAFGMIVLFFKILHSGQEIYALQMFSFVLGACIFSFMTYFLTLCFKSRMTSIGILVIFPLLIIPYIERMLPEIVPLIFYDVVTDSLNSSIFCTSHLYLFFWLLLIIVLTYLKFRKES